MAVEKPLDTITLIATASLATKQFCAVKVDASNDFKCVICTAANNAIGILQNAPAAGDPAQIIALGMSKAIAGGAVTRGDNLKTDASGYLVTAGGSDPVVGIALDSATSGQKFTVYLVTRTASGTTGIANAYDMIAFEMPLDEIADGDLFNFSPPYAGDIVKIMFTTGEPVTTGAKKADISCEIAGVACTGGLLALTSAACTPRGKQIAGSAFSALYSFTAGQEITIKAANTVAFIEGDGHIILVLKQ